jgi:hypothetical protein
VLKSLRLTSPDYLIGTTSHDVVSRHRTGPREPVPGCGSFLAGCQGESQPLAIRVETQPFDFTQVSNSPLAQKIQFLESKGLTSTEIEKAMIRASEGPSSTTASPNTSALDNTTEEQVPQQVYNHAPEFQGTRTTNHVQYGPPGRHGPGYATQMQAQPALPQRDWRDYFVS